MRPEAPEEDAGEVPQAAANTTQRGQDDEEKNNKKKQSKRAAKTSKTSDPTIRSKVKATISNSNPINNRMSPPQNPTTNNASRSKKLKEKIRTNSAKKWSTATKNERR